MSFQSNYAVRAGGIVKKSELLIQWAMRYSVMKLEKFKLWREKRKSSLNGPADKKDYWASFGEFSCSESSGRCEGGVSDVRVKTIKHQSWGRGNASWKFFWSAGLETVMSHSQHHIPCGS